MQMNTLIKCETGRIMNKYTENQRIFTFHCHIRCSRYGMAISAFFLLSYHAYVEAKNCVPTISDGNFEYVCIRQMVLHILVFSYFYENYCVSVSMVWVRHLKHNVMWDMGILFLRHYYFEINTGFDARAQTRTWWWMENILWLNWNCWTSVCGAHKHTTQPTEIPS